MNNKPKEVSYKEYNGLYYDLEGKAREFAGEISCEDCIFGPFQTDYSLDPRISRYEDDCT